MQSAQQIIDKIHEDAPCVYDILHEQCFPNIRGNSYPWSDSQFTWNDFFKANPDIERPIADALLEELVNYDWDNYDVHYWHGRYSQMLEDNNRGRIRIPLTESDCHDIMHGERFDWRFQWVDVFVFNTDRNPEYNLDSPYFDPAIFI
jgi:hypothetical protein